MSDGFVLTLRAQPDAPLDASGVTPDAVAEADQEAVKRVPLWVGNRQASVGDFFTVVGRAGADLRVVGELSAVHGLGAGMSGGALVIEGHAGHRVGVGMSGGTLVVHGTIGDDGGQAMSGGTLRVHGDAGRRLGGSAAGAARGMTGGAIVVDGRVGDGAAARMRRGLVVVGGDTGDEPGRAMIAGTLVVFGRTGVQPMAGNKRGSLVAVGGVDVPGSYLYACTYEPPFVRLLMTHLFRHHGLAGAPRARDAAYARYCGEQGGVGKGEILKLVAPA